MKRPCGDERRVTGEYGQWENRCLRSHPWQSSSRWAGPLGPSALPQGRCAALSRERLWLAQPWPPGREDFTTGLSFLALFLNSLDNTPFLPAPEQTLTPSCPTTSGHCRERAGPRAAPVSIASSRLCRCSWPGVRRAARILASLCFTHFDLSHPGILLKCRFWFPGWDSAFSTSSPG